MRTNELDISIAKELINTEKKRLVIFICVLLFGIAIIVANILLFPAYIDELYNDNIDLYNGLTLNFVFVAILLVSRIIVERISKRKMLLPMSYNIYATVIETSMPMIWLVQMIDADKSALFLDSPLTFIYVPLIIVSSLQLSFSVGMLTGTLVGIFYISASYWALNTFPGTAGFPDIVYYTKGILFIMAGACAGLVALEIKKRLSISLQAQKEKDQIETLFSQQVSKEVADSLKAQGDISVKGIATIFFLDIRNFTKRIQYLPPEEISEFQNKFFGPIIDCMNARGGVIYQIMGDGFMASFKEGDHEKAFEAGKEILNKINEMNSQYANPVKVGIGIHTGEIVAGNIGSNERRQFSISGVAVVMAARLEQMTKDHDCSFLVSIDFYEKIKHLTNHGESLGMIKMKGLDEEIEVIKLC